jgi:preprotein translocase subunit SecF
MSESNTAVPSHLTLIPFMRYRRLAVIFSALVIVASLASLAVNGLKFGLDFTGGTQIEVGYSEPADLEKIRAQLLEGNFTDPVVVHFGVDTEVKILLQDVPDAEGVFKQRLEQTLGIDGENVVLKRDDYVGPQIGEELRDQGGLGMVVALLIVMGYVAFRFQYKFSFGAVAALIHDVIVVLGFFSLLQLDFDLTVLAAILAVIGYSLNDTIVVSDRIRENFRKIRQSDAVEIIDISLSETLGRTLVTSLTTLLVLLALFFVGGEQVKGFSIGLIVGVVIGTYSSVYVAANILLSLKISTQDLLEPVKEGAEFDDMP